MSQIRHVSISGFKSIRESEVELGRINVLIGANGSGKSNLLSVLHMISFLSAGELQTFVGTRGRASSLLHYGPKRTPEMHVALRFETPTGESRYEMRLAHAAPDSLLFVDERIGRLPSGGQTPLDVSLGTGHWETRVLEQAPADPTARVIRKLLGECKVFQFHDTSPQAPIRVGRYIGDNRFLRTDAGNLCAFLYRLQQQRREYYDRIVAVIRQVAPFFREFVLAPAAENTRELTLDWRDHDPEGLFGPHQLSDGTLRAMALIALLLQPPDEMPEITIIDEPELGLHPFALEVIAGLMKSAADQTQLILATQSAALVDQFSPADVIVVDRRGGETCLSRPDEGALREWLREYAVGELWEKNVLGGRPVAWSG